MTCDAPPARAQSGANRQLLAAAFDANQQQVGNVGAGDQQNQDDRSHQHPQHFAYIPDHILLQWPQIGGDARLYKEIGTKSFGRGKAAQNDGKQARHVRTGLLQGDARL